MFIGHYGIAFFLKRKFKDINLGLLFASVLLADIVAFILVILGIESISYSPHANPFLRTKIEYLPFSHSLFANAVLALLVFLILWKMQKTTWGIALSIGILSHWFLDLIVHTSDLPLFLNSYKVGFGLWQFPWLSFFLEIALLLVGVCYYYKTTVFHKRAFFLIALMVAGFSVMFFGEEPSIIQTNMKIRSLVVLLSYIVFIALAHWSEKGERNTSSEIY